MDVFAILDHVKMYLRGEGRFKIGFVGNGEPFLDWPKLKSFIAYLEDDPHISTYTITNGTILLPESELLFLENHRVNVGFSIDGPKQLHDLYREHSFDRAMRGVEWNKSVTGHYPTFNATVGKETLATPEPVIDFFEKFGTRITFSRMIGRHGIGLDEYRRFLKLAEKRLDIRRGGNDCTMYGGQCGAGINNFFFANGSVYYCGNCIDCPPIADSGISLFDLEKISLDFDRNRCYKESL